MKAMILAAGLGTRLHPLTKVRPKALVEVRGVPLLEIVLKRLLEVGVSEIIVNLHHFPEQIIQFLQRKNYFGIHIEFSQESQLLDTGGGLKKAASFFDDGKPFFLHNVDVISDINLLDMYRYHETHGNLATLAVKSRPASRYLIFDQQGLLCGWQSPSENKQLVTRQPAGSTSALGFCGIHVISPVIFTKMEEQGAFSIIDCYLRLAGQGELIRAFRVDDYCWEDVGSYEKWLKLNNY